MTPHEKTEAVAVATEAALATAGAKMTYAGAGTTLFGWLFSSQGAVAMGILLGVLGYVTQAFFSWRRDRREARESRARLKSMGEQPTDF